MISLLLRWETLLRTWPVISVASESSCVEIEGFQNTGVSEGLHGSPSLQHSTAARHAACLTTAGTTTHCSLLNMLNHYSSCCFIQNHTLLYSSRRSMCRNVNQGNSPATWRITSLFAQHAEPLWIMLLHTGLCILYCSRSSTCRNAVEGQLRF